MGLGLKMRNAMAKGLGLGLRRGLRRGAMRNAPTGLGWVFGVLDKAAENDDCLWFKCR